MASIRRSTPQDREAVVATVIDAFDGDPAWDFFFGPHYRRDAHHLAEALFDLRIGAEAVWVADDGAAVAIWVPPGPADPTVDAAQRWIQCRALIGEPAWQRLRAYDQAVEQVRAPLPPHWYLGVLATSPDKHGMGLGTAVMAPGMALADEADLDCYLETSKVSNRGFYTHRGFAESTPIAVVDGPPTWWMRRQSGARATSTASI